MASAAASEQPAVSAPAAEERAAAVQAARLAAPAEQPSMALVPAAGAGAPAHAAALAPAAAAGAAQLPAGIHEQEEPWPFVTKALMVAVMASQPPAAAAATLLAVFQPLLDGYGVVRRESRGWRERSEAAIAEHQKHKSEQARKHDALHVELQALQRRLRAAEANVRELESDRTTLSALSAALEKKLAEAEAAAIAARQALSLEAQEREKESEALRKAAQDSQIAHDRLRQDEERRTHAHNAEILKLNTKINDIETNKAKMEERLLSTLSKSSTLEGQLAQKSQELSNLQNRYNELNARKEALDRQLAFYQRTPTRRFM